MKKKIGYLLLITDVNYINQSVRVLRFALGMGMLIAMAVGLVIAMVLRSKIVKPIKALHNEIVKATDDPTHEVKVINSNDEIEALSRAFLTMDHTISAHMNERKRFFQNASHELKTPLMSIQGYAEAIKDGIVEGDEVDKSLDIIIRKSQQLKKTVEEIIYLSKLVNNDFDYTYRNSSLSKLINTAIVDQELLAKELGINIKEDMSNVPSGLELKMDEEKNSECV